MMRAGRGALVAAAGLLLNADPVASLAQPAQATLTVSDHLGAGQTDETIAVYLGGVLKGTLHVDADHPDDSFVATVPAIPNLPFALCGKLVRQEAAGQVSNHPIDNGGTLAGYAGRSWAAVTLGDVLFTLRDESGVGQDTVSSAPACNAAVS